MHKYTALGFLGVGLMVSPLLTHFAGSAVPVSPKIGAIDVQRTFAESGAGKRANTAFTAKQKQKQSEIQQKEKDFGDAQQALEKQKTMLKQDVYDSKKQDLYKQYMELQKAAQKADQELAVEEQKTLDALLTQAEPLIKSIAAAEGVQLIVDTKAVVYYDPTMDLTDKLIAKMP